MLAAAAPAGPTAWRPALSVALPTVLLGLAAAAVVAADPFFDGLIPIEFPIPIPLPRALLFPVTALLGIVLALAVPSVSARRWLFDRRLRINIGFVVVFAVIPGFHYGPIHPSGFALVASVLFLAVAFLVEDLPVRGDRVAVVLVGIMTIFCFTSILNGRLITIISLHTLLTKFALLLIMPNLVRDRRDLEWALRLTIRLAMLSALLAIATLIVYVLTGQQWTYDDLMEVKNTPFGRLMRTTAFFSTTQGLAHAMLLAIALTLFMPAPAWRRLVVVTLLSAAICTTFSAGALASLMVCFFLAPFVAWPRKSLHIMTAFLAMAATAHATGLIDFLMQRVILPLGAGNAEERVEFFRAGLQALHRAPILGHGIKFIGMLLDTAVHNAYLQMTADIGLIGGAAYIGLIGYLLVRSFANQAWLADAKTKAWAKGLFLGLVVMAYHFLSEPFYDNTFSWLFMGLVLSSLLILSNLNEGGPRMESEALFAGSTTDRTLAHYGEVMYRRRYSILVVMVSAIVFSLIFSHMLPPRYEAEAVFYVPADVTRSGSDRETPGQALPTGDRDGARAHGALLKGRETLLRISAMFPHKSLSQISRDVDVVAARNSLISVYVRDKDPVVAADMANALVTVFDQMVMGATTRDLEASIQRVEQELTTVRARLEAAWQRQRALQDQHSKLPPIVAALNGTEREIHGLKEYQSNLRTTEESLRKRLLQVRGSAVVVQRAFPPASPVFPIPILNGIVAGVFGFVVGVFYAFLLNFIQERRHLHKLQLIQAQEWSLHLSEEFPVRRVTGGA